jgi:peroxiredoxin
MRYALCLLSTLVVAAGAFAQVPHDPSEVKPLKAGQFVPGAMVQTMDGKSVNVKSVIKGKKSVLVFYRGGWCPFCNRQLAELGHREPDIKKAGYQVIAVSPDSKDSAMQTKEKVGYTILSDGKADLIKAFGLAFQLDDQTFDKYKNQHKLDLEKRSGHTHRILPVPAVYVIDANGKITFAHYDPDYSRRLPVNDLMSKLK